MATKKSAKKTAKKSAKKAAKKASKKTARRPESTPKSVFDTSVNERAEDDSSIFSSSMREEGGSFSSPEPKGEAPESRVRIIAIVVVGALVILGFFLWKKRSAPQQPPVTTMVAPKPAEGVAKPAEKPAEKPVEKPAEAVKPVEAAKYKIVKGDNPSAIARKNKITLKQLQDANPGLDWKKIKTGQEINLPPKGN